jgi:hypothetical protein
VEGEWREAEGSGAEEGEYGGEEGRGRGRGGDNFWGESGERGPVRGTRGDGGVTRGDGSREARRRKESSDEVPTHACTHVAHRAGSLLAVCGVYLLVQRKL